MFSTPYRTHPLCRSFVQTICPKLLFDFTFRISPCASTLHCTGRTPQPPCHCTTGKQEAFAPLKNDPSIDRIRRRTVRQTNTHTPTATSHTHCPGIISAVTRSGQATIHTHCPSFHRTIVRGPNHYVTRYDSLSFLTFLPIFSSLLYLFSNFSPLSHSSSPFHLPTP